MLLFLAHKYAVGYSSKNFLNREYLLIVESSCMLILKHKTKDVTVVNDGYTRRFSDTWQVDLE